MRSNRLLLATPLLLVATACGSNSVLNQSTAAMAAEAKCQSRFDLKFHVQPRSKAVSEGFVQDLVNGRLRVKGSVPVRANQAHAGSYTCDVVPAPRVCASCASKRRRRPKHLTRAHPHAAVRARICR